VSLTLNFAGRARFLPMAQQAEDTLIVAVECVLADLPPMHAMLDTAAQWSLLPGRVAQAMGYSAEPDPDTPRYSTRKGSLHGRIEPVKLTFPAELGEAAVMEAPFYICESWDGPVVLGWTGCLESLCFALDARQYEELFYFGTNVG
jgi:hypothetical protein